MAEPCIRVLIIVVLGVVLLGAGCTSKQDAAHALDPAEVQAKLVARGRAIYSTNCTACHNADPKKPGSLGPDIAGSSLLLLEARILKQDYPPDYSAKRTTHLMPPLPQLKAEIPAIQAYLAAP